MAFPMPDLGSPTGTAGVASANPVVQMGRRATLVLPAASEGVMKGPDGRYYVSVRALANMPGTGSIRAISGDPFAGTLEVTEITSGLNSPLGLVIVGNNLFVVDRNRVWRVDLTTGEKVIHVAPDGFPGGSPANGVPGGALNLNGITADANGQLYIADSTRSVIFRVNLMPRTNPNDGTYAATVYLNNGLVSPLTGPNNLLFDPKGDISGVPGSILVTDTTARNLVAIHPLAQGETAPSMAPIIAPNIGQVDGMTFDAQGNLYLSSFSNNGQILRIKPDKTMEVFAQRANTMDPVLQGPSDIWVDVDKNLLIVPSITGTTMTFIDLQPAP
jgi:sugar lactone lactonase YvrE